jgi:hypothetical protein
MTEPLVASELAVLTECEATIRDGLQTFVVVGRALAKIRDGRLYRQTHLTFEAYCDQEFSLSRSRAYRFIEAAQVTEAMSPIGDIAVPATESQARELSGLAPETAAEVMRTAAESSPKITASTIREAREVVAPRPAPTRAASQPAPPVPSYVHPETGEVLGEVPAGYTDVNPARVAADARREYKSSPWSVFTTKKLPDLRSLTEWLRLPEIGGAPGVVASMQEMAIPGTSAEDAAIVLRSLDEAAKTIDSLREAFRTASSPKLRRVQ